MTHDELLADMDSKILLMEHTIYPIYMQALRAVVELHTPDKFGFCYCSDIPKKCPTKEAIEKEVG